MEGVGGVEKEEDEESGEGEIKLETGVMAEDPRGRGRVVSRGIVGTEEAKEVEMAEILSVCGEEREAEREVELVGKG